MSCLRHNEGLHAPWGKRFPGIWRLFGDKNDDGREVMTLMMMIGGGQVLGGIACRQRRLDSRASVPGSLPRPLVIIILAIVVVILSMAVIFERMKEDEDTNSNT